jgi:starch-binding outer membrane protein, SusD/RagB family
MKKINVYFLSLIMLLSGNSCDKVYTSPSLADEEAALTTVNGLIALCNGLQYRYTIGRQSPGYAIIVASGLTTKELRVLNAGNTDELLLEQGAANVIGGNGIVRNLWTQLNIIRSDADRVLTNVGNIGDLGTRSGVIAFASVYKALAFGTLAEFFEKAPLINGEGIDFSTREDLLREAIKVLETANTTLAANAVSAAFTSRITPGLDLPNSINAMIARYSTMLGENDKALAASARVTLTVRSEFRFDDLTRNPIFDVATGNRNVIEPVGVSLGLPAPITPDSSDRRLDYYLRIVRNSAGAITGIEPPFVRNSTTPENNLARKNIFASNSAPIPVYLPGEMILIRAEAFARKNDLTNAVSELNRVRTKTTDAWGIGASLPPYSGAVTQDAILTEIYRNRCIELFLSGLKLEDSRRFGRPPATNPLPADFERNRNFYPYPLIERQNNPQTPADPTI